MTLNPPELFNARLFARWYRLRLSRPDLVPPLLQEPNGAAEDKIWTFTNPLDPWGSKERLSVAELERLVSQAELLAARKDLGSQGAPMREKGVA
jgi:hypothetical protein